MLSDCSSFADVERSGREGAVLPIGALEQHGCHLALGTDTFSGAALGRHIAQELDWYLLPALPFGTSHEHGDFPGTVSLSASTLGAIVKDVRTSLGKHGFKRLAVISGHGGNWMLKPAIRELNLTQTGGPMVLLVDPEVFFYPQVDRPGFHHGGEYETALMMHLKPEAVQKDFLPKGGVEPHLPRALLDCVSLRKLLPGGVWGKPELATPEMGAKLFQRAADGCVKYIRETFEMIESAERSSQNSGVRSQ